MDAELGFGPGDVVDFDAVARRLGLENAFVKAAAVAYAVNKTGAPIDVSLCTASADSIQVWLNDHNVAPAVNYVNYVGRTVRQIREEAALHASLAVYLQGIIDEVEGMDPRELRQRLVTHVEWEKHNGKLTLTPDEPTPLAWRLRNLAHLLEHNLNAARVSNHAGEAMFTAHLAAQAVPLGLQFLLGIFHLARKTHALPNQVGHHLQEALVHIERT